MYLYHWIFGAESVNLLKSIEISIRNKSSDNSFFLDK